LLTLSILLLFSINLFSNVITIVAAYYILSNYKSCDIANKKFIVTFLILSFFFILFQTLIYKNFNFQNFILIKIIIIIFLIFNKFKKNINVILNKYIIILILIISIFLLLEIVTGYNIRQLTSSSGLNKFSGIYGRHKIAGSIILYLVILISILSAKKNYRNYLTYVFCGLIIFLSGQRNPFIKFFSNCRNMICIFKI